jgi:hypothetical protein
MEIQMCKIFLMMMLGTLSISAMAEWTEVGSVEADFVSYVDLATIRRHGNLIKMWNLRDYKTTQKNVNQGYMSIRSQSEYDCKEEQSRMLAISTFSGNMVKGELVGSVNTDLSSAWEPVAPGTVGEAYWKIACGILKHK